MITPYIDKNYILIQPSEIAEICKPEFGIRGRKTESEYKQLIEDSQEYFQQYIENPNNKTYWIYERCDAACLYIDIGNAITVKKNQNGNYEFASNGRHRLYVAKKYNLPILVCCSKEKNNISVDNNEFYKRKKLLLLMKRMVKKHIKSISVRFQWRE